MLLSRILRVCAMVVLLTARLGMTAVFAFPAMASEHSLTTAALSWHFDGSLTNILELEQESDDRWDDDEEGILIDAHQAVGLAGAPPHTNHAAAPAPVGVGLFRPPIS